MIINKCFYCMYDISPEAEVCPHCGKRAGVIPRSEISLQPGTILHGKYLMGAVLGQGGFGLTYIGYDLLLGVKVAIKEYYPAHSAVRGRSGNVLWNTSGIPREDSCSSFLKEARKMAKLMEIPEVVRVHDIVNENNTAYIVMDFVEGITLKEKLKKDGLMSAKEILALLGPIAEAMDKVHKSGIIHKDISPDNIMIDRKGKARLLDLGAAKEIDMRGNSDKSSSSLIHKDGFSPAEQYTSGNDIGPWTDVYAFSATVYYCMTGKLVPSAMDRMCSKTAVPFPAGFPDRFRKVLEKGLAIRHQDRYQTMEELRQALVKALPSKKKKLAAGIIGAIAAAAAAAVAVGAVIMSPWQPKVTETGCPNTNLWLESDYQLIDKQYEYYMDTEWNLYVVPFNEEDQVFYIDNYTIVDDEAGSVNIGADKVYFIHDVHDEDGNHDSILQMNFDGSDIETVFEQDGLYLMQYVRLSDGAEYLYYMVCTDSDTSFDLYRYNIGTGKTEQVKSDIYWFNTDDRYLYYSTFNGQNMWDCCRLHRSFLDGSRDKILDDEHGLINGYVVDGNIYMASLYQEVMVQVDENEKNRFQTVGGDYSHEIYYESVYGDGWFYFYSEENRTIDRVRADGTGLATVAEIGWEPVRINYADDDLFVVEGTYDSGTGSYNLSSASLINIAEGSVLSLGTPTINGLTYTIVDSKAFITGYIGDEDHVSVPSAINGYPLDFSNQYTDDSLNNVQLCLEIPAEELTYEETDGGIRITGYTPDQSKDQDCLAVPAEIDGQPVVEIGENAFSNDDKQEDEQYTFAQMLLPETVRLIDSYAFYDCENLTYVNMPQDLQQIADNAFAYCPLNDLEIVFPEGMQSLGGMAFALASFKTVYLPDSVEFTDGISPFVGCGQDTEEAMFLVDEDSTAFCVEKGVLYNADKTVIYSVQDYVTGNLTIPDTVTEIFPLAFARADYDKVTVPSSVADYDYAFVWNNIEQIILEEGITEIPQNAFSSSYRLSSISIPDTVMSIGSAAFEDCDTLTEVTISADCAAADDAFDSSTSVIRT